MQTNNMEKLLLRFERHREQYKSGRVVEVLDSEDNKHYFYNVSFGLLYNLGNHEKETLHIWASGDRNTPIAYFAPQKWKYAKCLTHFEIDNLVKSGVLSYDA